MVNSPLNKALFIGGVALGGGTLGSHENNNKNTPREWEETKNVGKSSLRLFQTFRMFICYLWLRKKKSEIET